MKAAISDWTAGQATHFGTRGITVNAVASGRKRGAGLRRPVPHAGAGGAEIARLALFLSDTRRAAHHRADAARQPRRARPTSADIPAFAEAKQGDRPA